MAEETCTIGTSNIEYGVLGNTGQERKRKTTDVASLFMYIMFIVAWIGIAIYAYIYSRVSPLEFIRNEMSFLKEYLFFSPAILFFAWFCILLIICYFTMLRWCTKFAVYFTIFLEFLLITMLFITLSTCAPAIGIPILIFCYLIFWIEIQILRKSGVDMICKIIVDACRAIAFPSSLVIVFLYLFSYFLYGTLVGTVIYSLLNFEPERTKLYIQEDSYSYNPYIQEDSYSYNPYIQEHSYSYNPFSLNSPLISKPIEMRQIERAVSNLGLIVTFSLLSLWIFIVENFCLQFVLHGIFTNWCRMSNKGVIPRFNVALRYYYYAYRYHTGTFAFMSIPIVPIIQVIRTVCVNIHQLEMKIKESPYNIYCFLVIIGNMVSNSSIVCASHGKCFYPSMKGAFKVLIQNSMKFAAARLVITGMVFFGLTLIPSIMIGVVLLHIAIWNPINYAIYLTVTSLVSCIITTGVLCIFSIAVDSVLFCHLEELLNNEAYADEDPRNN